MALQNDDIPIEPHLRELENEIEENSEKWTLETIHRTQQRFSSITSRLNNVRNSRLEINKLDLDILYIIFTLVVYCPSSKTTALEISHVCHYWRILTLQWPGLWAVVDLKNPPTITDLFMTRSQSAPLTLSWWTPPDYYTTTFEKAPSKSYFVSHANSILPRLRSLSVNVTCSNFISLHQVIQNSKLPPLRLRHLTIVLLRSLSYDDEAPPLTRLIDNSCLRDIKLWGFDLPWLELPHNKLTHFTLKDPVNPPALSKLLAFLSNCACLEALELEFRDYDFDGIETIFAPTTPASLQAVNRLDFPSLIRLKLGAFGFSSYDYILQFSSCIRALKALSWFNLTYKLEHWHTTGSSPANDQLDKPFQIFGAVSPETFSHFHKYQYLAIDFKYEGKDLGIRGHTYVSDQHGSSELPKHQFVVHCKGLKLPINYSPILELVYAMPQIRHLTMKFYAWSIFTLPNIDIRKAFPCLCTLALIDCDTEALISLPDGFRVKRLILAHCIVLFDILSNVVESAGVEILEITKCYDVDGDADEVIFDLRAKGVYVIWNELEGSDELEESDEPDGSDGLNGADQSDQYELDELDGLEW